jgi:hypothetical protein
VDNLKYDREEWMRYRKGIDVEGGGFLVELTTSDVVRPDEPHFCTAWAEEPVIVHYPKNLAPGGDDSP